MHYPSPRLRPCCLLAGLVLACASLPATAAEMGGVAIHGSLSGTAAYSPDYNYLGDTKDAWDLNQVELIVNGTKRFDNGIKLAAQIYAYELAGYEDITVDFANLDYSFRPELGIRVGRNKMPLGFYNEVQDLDQVRVFASLPLNFYPRATRAITAAYDGASLYGNLPAGKAGSLDYQIFGGTMHSLDEQMPMVRGAFASHLDPNNVYGGALVWNAPIEGLRLGYSYRDVPKGDTTINQGMPVVLETDNSVQVASIEYTRGKWTAVAEYQHVATTIDVINLPVPTSTLHEDHSYAQLTYQATDKIGLGVYYAYSDYEQTSGVDKDAAFAAAYAIQPWWIVKAEVHAMDGVNNLDIAGDSNPSPQDETWTYFVLKTTVSF